MINAEFLFLLTLSGFAFIVCTKLYKLGGKTRNADNLESLAEEVDAARKTRDRINNNSNLNRRVRAKYRRK